LELIPDLLPPKTDWIFFSSPGSLQLYHSQYNTNHARIAVIGKGTFYMAEKLGLKVSFLPKSDDTEEAIREFKETLEEGEVVLYAKGRQSLNRLNEVLPSPQVVDFIFYDTVVAANFPQAQSEHLCFTSPSNVNAYFDRFGLENKQRAYAIGHTTAKALKSHNLAVAGIADEPGEEGFWKLIS